MTRRLWTAALALSIAGGVYLAGAPAQASNMGFKLERDVDFKRNASGVALQNIYWVSVPLFSGVGDVANSLAIDPGTNQPYKNKCVGETGGPTTGDGWESIDDYICDWWTARITSPGALAGTFSLTYFNRNDCIPKTRNAVFRLGVPNFSGDLFPADDGDGDPSNNTDVWTDIGLQVNLAATGATDTPRNRVIIVGSHDPGFPGHPISATPDCANTGGALPCCNARAAQVDLIGVPYHTMFRSAVELLCGLEGTDWTDDGMDQGGKPAGTAGDARPDSIDECDTAAWDQTNALAVSMWFNDITTNGPKTCSVSKVLGRISWSACPNSQNFSLVPGEAYQYNILRTHVGTTTFLSPHF